MADKWKSRICGHDEVPVGDLKPHPLNPRTHPSSQADPLSAVLDEVGWVGSVIVSRRTNLVLDGHLRLQLAKDSGEPTVPVVYVDVDSHEETLILATFDRISASAMADADAFASLAASVVSDNSGIQLLLSNYLDELVHPVPPRLPEATPAFAMADTSARIGDICFPIERDVFLAWQEDVRASSGFSEDAVNEEILRRLGL